MPSLHALLIAINNYPNPTHRLNGCLNDLEQVLQCLETCCAALGLGFAPKILRDDEATRANVIEAFEHFEAAAPDDPCLFFYAGHGARSAAPETFWHLEPDHKNDSIVCYDSRTPGGRDLMDKELSYLIWKANEGKSLPFVSITDCCHSGTLRDLGKDNKVAARQIRETGAGLEAGEYLGIEHYKRSDNGELSPPQGRRVHLAAARDAETAKEVPLAEGQRGVFSHFLVETLRLTGPTVSYHELLSRVQMRVRGNIADQSPQLWASQEEDKYLGLFTNTAAVGKKNYLVGFDKYQGWLLNAGAIHGLSLENGPVELDIPELKRTVTLVETQPTFSKVAGMAADDAKRTYPAFVARHHAPKLKVAVAGEGAAPCAALLTDWLRQEKSDVFVYADTPSGADLVVRFDAGSLWLSRTHDTTPLFGRVENCGQADLPAFMARMETVGAWRLRLERHNPYSQIGNDEFAIELYAVIEPGNVSDDAPTVLLDSQQAPVLFQYAEQNGVAHKPAFQLKVRNTGTRPLWFGLLYFGCDYSISNALLPKQLLAGGEEAWASDVFQGYAYRTIPLEIGGDFLAKGVTQIDEFFKLVVSTDELDTDLLCQQGLGAPHRQLGFRQESRQRDWRCVEVCVRVSL